MSTAKLDLSPDRRWKLSVEGSAVCAVSMSEEFGVRNSYIITTEIEAMLVA